MVNDVTPFEDKILIGNLSEKDIVNAIKVGGQSFNHSGHKPGILMLSGMRYTMTDKGELKALSFVDKEGVEHAIDVNNPNPNKTYTVAMDDFFAMGGDNYLPSNEHPDFIVKKFDFDKNKLTCNYVKKMTQPMHIVDDGRIKIEKSAN